jgi:hypothetical protein
MAKKTGAKPTAPTLTVSLKPADVKRVILQDDDFGHEMRVGNIFGVIRRYVTSSDNKIAPEHGGTYTDLHAGKPRQFDYRFQIRNRYDKSRCVFLAVECKNLHESSPLVVCGRSRTHEEAYHTFIESSRTPPFSVTRKTGNSIYTLGEFVGKSLVRLKNESSGQLKSASDSDVYDRWSQALSSSVELAERAGSLSNDSKNYPDYPDKVLSMIMPVVVVPDGLLWKASYDQAGQISEDPALVEECEFFVGRFRIEDSNSSQNNLTHIHFVTLKGFSKLLTLIDECSDTYWNKLLPRS